MIIDRLTLVTADDQSVETVIELTTAIKIFVYALTQMRQLPIVIVSKANTFVDIMVKVQTDRKIWQ